MFCNKERIKISSFSLFSRRRWGKQIAGCRRKRLLAMLSAVRCLCRKMSGRFFIFCTKSKKTLYKKYSESGRLSEAVRCVCGKC